MQRPKSARNLLRNSSKTPTQRISESSHMIQPQKELIEAFQQRDKEIIEKKKEAVAKLEKAKTAPEIIKMYRPNIVYEGKSTLTVGFS